MNDGGHTHSMAAAPPPSNATMMMHHRHMMMHMTFFWGKNAEILFDGILRGSSSPASVVGGVGMLQTLLYAVRIGLAYLVMLAVMSFNAGVFLVAIAGHSIGFFLFGSRAFNKQAIAPGKTSDLPPMNCC
ncbi:UNVERIFIED_CONTAM: Copper transporter 1 [Sesamum radiatum]|uniref:Copper transport protein n=1 Tax=Sesamum radiatum TaxID=300843 RepID=A0AAW2UMW1_SESRA